VITTSKINGIKEKIQKAINAILPSKEVDLDEVKDGVWKELSRIYYKYEDESQKQAFREIMREIGEKLSEGKWSTIYHKLYQKERGASD